MGFYIEDLPTEFNGITMQEADYLADEFLKDTPCNRMWDAMRALRDFYETVTSEAVDMADRKTSNVSEIPTGSEPQYEMGMGTLKCDNCSEYGSFKCVKCDGEMYFKRHEPKDEPTISKMEQVDKDINVRSKDEPQTNADQHVQHVGSVEPMQTEREGE